MRDLKIKLWFLGEFLFTVKVNGEEKEIDRTINTVTFQLPENADYEIEITQKQPPSNHRLKNILLMFLHLILIVILIFVFQDGFFDEWGGDIQPFLIRARIRGNMREHRELNFYYHKSRNIKDEYTKPRLVCDGIAPYEVICEANRMDIKKKFHCIVEVISVNALILLVLFSIILIGGLVSPINTVAVIVSSVCIAATVAVCVFILIRQHKKWYKYYYL